MKSKIKILIFLIFFIILGSNSNGKENKILVKVNNEIITTIDILNEIKFLSLVNKEFKKIDKDQQIKIAKNGLIREKIKSIELLKFKKNLNLDDKIFEQILKNYFIDQDIKNLDQYKIFLGNNNLNIDFVRDKISIDTFWKAFIYEKFHKNVKIDEDEIKKNILQKEKQIEYLLSEIVFLLEKNEKLDEKLQIIKKLIQEKNFAEAAFSFSISDTSNNGGKLGWIKENVLNKEIKKELRNISIGEFTNPIVIPGGFLILYKEMAKEIKNNYDLEKEIKIIINKKTNDQLNRFSNIYLGKLKKNIQINEI